MSEETQTTEPESTTPAPPETSQGNPEGEQQAATTQSFTQADVDRIVGERVKRAEKSVTSGILEALGVDSLDTVKGTLEAERKRKEAEMSEAEKLQLEIETLKQSLEAEKQRAAQLERQRLEDSRDNGLLQLLERAHDKDAVLALIKARHNDRLEALVGDDGTFDKAEAEKLIAEFESSNGYLFQSGTPGSPSNRNGRVPDPSAGIKERIRKATKKHGI